MRVSVLRAAKVSLLKTVFMCTGSSRGGSTSGGAPARSGARCTQGPAAPAAAAAGGDAAVGAAAGAAAAAAAAAAGGLPSDAPSQDFHSKLLHLAWHPEANLIAAAASNSLYMYCAH